jgi:hypothetical protein
MRRSFKKTGLPASFLIVAIALVVACGGGGIGDLASSGGGTGGTGISVGSVSAIGSVHVNGIRYDTGSAEIFVEGRSTGFGDTTVIAQLAVGMVVRVEGDVEDSQNGTARRVYFNDDLRGPVESIIEVDSIPIKLSVLGKDIILQETTQTGGYDIHSLAVGDWVQVSGFEDAEGRIHALFLTESTSSAKANLKGMLSELNTTTRNFKINGIRIDYQTADLIGINQLSENLLVEVTGVLSDDHLSITAEKIELDDLLGTRDADEIELEGVIFEKTSDTEFLLNGVRVILDPQTAYSGGVPSDIAGGVFVEVEGELINGIVYAAKVIFLNDVKAEANVITNEVAQSELFLDGLPDITITYDDEITKVTGDAVTAAAIDNTHHVKILGQQTLPGTLMAIHIIVKSGLNDTVKIQGPLENYTTPEVTVLDQVIDLTAIPDDNFESPEGIGVSREAFIELMDSGDPFFISVRGQLTAGPAVDWQSISAE